MQNAGNWLLLGIVGVGVLSWAAILFLDLPNPRAEFIARCTEEGGITIETESTRYCIREEALIEW